MSYKKWVYKYKYLKTENEEFSKKMEKYIILFHKDFKPNKSLKPILENPKSKEKSIKTVQELDREKLEKKFSKKKKETLN